MTWVFLALLAPFTWAIVNIIDRYVMLRVVRTPFASALVYCCVGLIASTLIYFFVGFESITLNHIALAVIAGASMLAASLLYLSAVQQEEISRVIPLLYFVPLYLSVLAAIFLNEVFSVWQYVGIVLLVLGATLITYRPGKFQVSRAFRFIAMAALFWTVAAMLEKYLVQTNDVWTVYAWARIGAGLAAPVLGIFVWRELLMVVKTLGASRLVIMGVNESINILAQLFVFFALALGPVTLVSALGSVQSFFVLALTLLIAIWYPKLLEEEMTKGVVLQKITATVLMFLGAFLVV